MVDDDADVYICLDCDYATQGSAGSAKNHWSMEHAHWKERPPDSYDGKIKGVNDSDIMSGRYRLVLTDEEIDELIHALQMAEQEGVERSLATNKGLRSSLKSIKDGQE